MKHFQSFFSFIFLFALSFSSFAELVNKIEINGLDRISRGTVLNYLPIEVGDNIYEPELQVAVDSLIKTNFFAQVSISVKDNSLVINLVENPTVKFIDFIDYDDGSVIDENVINDIVKNFNLSIGSIFVEDNLKKLIENLKFLYVQNAFYNAQINLKTSIDAQNRIGIELTFVEGDRALISKMDVTGNNLFDTDEILELFEIGLPDFFIINYFTEKDNYSSVKYEAGLENIIRKYNDFGFLDINVNNSKVVFNKEKNEIHIKIEISEGKQYTINSVALGGDLANVPESKIKSLLSLSKGDIFERKKIISSVAEIKELYQNLGYSYANIKLDAKKNKDSSLDISLFIEPDSRVYINRINITGNNKTQDDVIRREMSLIEGQVYTKDDLDQSIIRIKRLGFFSSVDYSLNRHKESPDKIDLLIEVVETKTGEFSIGLSHSNSTGVSLNMSVSQKNIFGTGNTLNASIANSDAVEEMSFYFLNPYFNKLGHTISYGFFDKTINAADLDASAYSISETGVNFGYGVPLFKDSKIYAETRISDLSLTCGSSLAIVDEVSQCSNPNNNDVTGSITYSHNSLNDYLFPTNGSKSTFSLLTSVPIGDLKYFTVEASHKDYQPILENLTFKFSSRFKLAQGYGGQDLPFYKRYFEGGSSSVRGFDFNSLGAKYTSSGKPKGGEVSIVSTLGISSSMKSIGIDNPNMKFISFIDAGILSEKLSNFDMGDTRSSFGVGINWVTPVGPLGFHYAIPLLKKSPDVVENFSFELGTSF